MIKLCLKEKEKRKEKKNYKTHNCTVMRYVLNVGVLIINDDYDDHDDYAAFNIVQYRIKIIVRSQKKKTDS